MTRAKPNPRNSEFDTQVLKGELFRLASIDLLDASSSEGKAVCLRASLEKRGASLILISKPQFEILFKKHLTVEMTWAKTGNAQVAGSEERF